MNKLHKIIAQVAEIKIGKPTPSKGEVLDWWFSDEGNIYLLSRLTQEPNVDALVQSEGYDNLEDYLTDNYGLIDRYEGEGLEKTLMYIKYYYRLFKHEEIYVNMFGDGNGMEFRARGVNYSFIDITYIGNGDYMFYAYN